MYCTFNNKKINTKDSPFLTNTTKREILFLEKIHFLKSPEEIVLPSSVEEAQPATGAYDTVLLCSR